MIRNISFNEFGNIVVKSETHTDEIYHGVVLLTPEQVAEAAQHGWKEVPSAPSKWMPGGPEIVKLSGNSASYIAVDWYVYLPEASRWKEQDNDRGHVRSIAIAVDGNFTIVHVVGGKP